MGADTADRAEIAVPVASAEKRKTARRRAVLATTGALVVWVALIVIARLWGDHLIDALGRDQLRLSAPPLVGWDDWRLGPRVLVPLVAGGVLIAGAPAAARRLTWRQLLVAAALATVAWGRGLDERDPPWVVSDEIAGMFLALAAPLGYTIALKVGLGLVAFRAFDVVKPIGIRRLEKLPGGWGILADDLAAGALTGLILVAVSVWLRSVR